MTNPVLENLKTRRAVRQFLPKQVEQEKLDLILEAGTYAPTGMGKQSPVIIAVQNPEMVQKLVRLNARVMHAETDPYYGAPTILLVLADPQRGTLVEDGSCVLENMMLAAHSLGVESCWIHREREMFESEEGKALLHQWGLTQPLTGVGALALGYAAEELPQPKPRKEGYIVKVL
ncbi:MAG: nitroreductase [Oscillospiraceae bacterium]|nr:nitroreductase [Oscillospiraceae bacterium]